MSKLRGAVQFDKEDLWSPDSGDLDVIMFSGGLDSTCGVYDVLANSQRKVFLASHSSHQVVTSKTQNVIVGELKRQFPGRIHHLRFECHLSGTRASEETQRTRSFLYASVGATIARAFGQNKILFFENGVLSINLPPSEQLLNARATRTTHPKVLSNMSQLLSLVNGEEFAVENPFFWKTKADVATLLKNNKGLSLLNNTVSCSRIFDKNVKDNHTHCGRCSQCIDRRFGLAGAGMHEEDIRGLYARDFVVDNICPDGDEYGREERTMLVDYIRLAMDLYSMNPDTFQDKWLDQLTDVTDYIEGTSDIDKIERLNALFVRHGKQVVNGITAFYDAYAKQLHGLKHNPNSLAEILSKQDYLDTPPKLLSGRISEILTKALPIACQSHKPKNEKEVQDLVEALLEGHKEKLNREYPHVKFGLSKTVPDASTNNPYVIIEIKYPRGKTPPSKINAEIAEDFTKYPEDAFLLCIIYDPERKIKDDDKFAKDFERKRACEFCFIR